MTRTTAALLALLALFSGCLNTTEKWDVHEKPVVVIAHLYAVSQTPAFLIFKNSYLEVEFGDEAKIERVIFSDGGEIMAAMRNGEVDIAYVGTPYPVSSYNLKPNVKIIAGTNIGGHALIARHGSGVSSIEDLRGKIVGVHAFGTPNDIFLRSILLPRGGLTADDVEIIKVASPEQKTMLLQGAIDAVEAHEPWVSRLLLDPQLETIVLIDSKDIWRNGSYPTSTVVARQEFLEKHPNLAKKFVRAHVDAVMFAINNPEQTQSILHDEILSLSGKELPNDVIRSAWTRVTPTYNPQSEAILELADYTQQSYPDRVAQIPSENELFNLGFLEEVLAEKNLPEDPLK